jgi:hypothetical protein
MPDDNVVPKLRKAEAKMFYWLVCVFLVSLISLLIAACLKGIFWLLVSMNF